MEIEYVIIESVVAIDCNWKFWLYQKKARAIVLNFQNRSKMSAVLSNLLNGRLFFFLNLDFPEHLLSPHNPHNPLVLILIYKEYFGQIQGLNMLIF